MNKKRLMIAASLLIMVIVISTVYYLCLPVNNIDAGITAMDGKLIVDTLAHEWCDNATLYHIRKASEMVDDGTFSKWIFIYCDSQNISSNTTYIEIELCSNGSSRIIDEDIIGLSTPPFSKPISNWTIDSDKAYEIAHSDEKIQSFFSNYDPVVDSFSLRIDMDTQKTIWSIYWDDTSSASSFENYHRASIEIDATTGEVIYVEVDD